MPGCDRVARARLRLVAAARRRLADRDERLRVAGLDPGVAGGGELRVRRRADDLALRVELRASGRARGSTRSRSRRTARTGSRRCGRSSERRPPWRSSGSRPSTSAGSCAPLLPFAHFGVPQSVIRTSALLRLRVADELVEIVEAVGRVERVRRVRRLRRRDVGPRHERPQDRRVVRRRRGLASRSGDPRRSAGSGSSWKPTHIRSADAAIGARTAAARIGER